MLSLLNEPDDALLMRVEQLTFVKLSFREINDPTLIFSSRAE